VVPVQLDLPGYTINWDTVKAKISAKTKAIIINTPHNPSGAVITEHDIAMLREVVEGTGIIIISDEVYEHLIFDGKPHLSILRYPDLYERSFVCYSFGKTYHCTGWKMGYCFAPAPLMAEFRKVHQFNAFTCNTPMQHAFAGILDEADLYLDLGRQMQAKRDHLANGLKGTGFEPLPSHGSYFQVYSYAALTDEKEKEFAVRMTKEIGVATIPVSAFYKVPQDNHVVRFCFAKKEETLDAAVEKIRGWVLKC
jgi:methionine aminotransferase